MRFILVLFLAGMPLATAAADEEEEDLEAELFFEEAETVSTATRHEQPILESPSTITVITRDELRASGARTIVEALRLVPNMDVQAKNSFAYALGMRGGTSGNADTMLLLVNGRDITLELFGFPSYRAHTISVDDIERIEVIRGPGSALYGANAYAGVINVFTRPPGEGPQAVASVRGGEHGMLELYASGSGRAGPLALTASVGFAREDLWTGRGIPAVEQLRGRLHGEADLGGDMRLTLETGGYGSNGVYFFSLGEVDLDVLAGAFARVAFEYDELSVQVVYDYFVIDGRLTRDLYYEPVDVVLAELPDTEARNDKVTVKAEHALPLPYNRLAYGAEFILNHYRFEMLLEPHHDEYRLGIYLQDEADLAAIVKALGGTDLRSLVLTVGLRFDYNSVTDLALSPRAALVWSPVERHSFRLGYAHAFLKPTFLATSMDVRLEDVNNLGMNRLDMSSDELSNETIDSLEAGYTANLLDERLQLRLDLSYNWYRNDILFEVDYARMEYNVAGLPDLTGPGIGSINDPDGQHGHSLELQVVARPTERSRLFFQAGYRQVFNSATGAFMDGEPVWILGAGADLRGESGWSLSLRAYYTDSHYSLASGYKSLLDLGTRVWIPASWLLNARFAWKLSDEPFGLVAGVEAFNLLGFRFREFGGFSAPNRPDYGGERLGRRIVFFLHASL